jgi:hypothetical protein
MLSRLKSSKKKHTEEREIKYCAVGYFVLTQLLIYVDKIYGKRYLRGIKIVKFFALKMVSEGRKKCKKALVSFRVESSAVMKSIITFDVSKKKQSVRLQATKLNWN